MGMAGKKHSEASRKKMSEDRKGEKHPMFGKHWSEDAIQNMSEAKVGEKNPMFGRTQSEDTRRKMSEARQRGNYIGERSSMFGKKGIEHPAFGTHWSEERIRKKSENMMGEKNKFYGRTHSEETRRKIGESNKGKIKSEETRRKLSEQLSKEKNPSWKGGITILRYCKKFDDRRKEAVREFFNHICICCGKHTDENITTTMRCVKLSVHHIDHDKEQGCNGKPFNLVPLCMTCHGPERHYGEEYKAYINKTLREGFKWGIWNEEEYKEKVMY